MRRVSNHSARATSPISADSHEGRSGLTGRPNFILFITDQHRADYLGCYGHPILQTPHIDNIAARGVAFDMFYIASPVRMPNRAS